MNNFIEEASNKLFEVYNREIERAVKKHNTFSILHAPDIIIIDALFRTELTNTATQLDIWINNCIKQQYGK